MVESGIKELVAAALAGLVVIAVADFVFLSKSTGKYFTPSLGAAGTTPGYAPATTSTPAGGGLPDPVTC